MTTRESVSDRWTGGDRQRHPNRYRETEREGQIDKHPVINRETPRPRKRGESEGREQGRW